MCGYDKARLFHRFGWLQGQARSTAVAARFTAACVPLLTRQSLDAQNTSNAHTGWKPLEFVEGQSYVTRWSGLGGYQDEIPRCAASMCAGIDVVH